MSKEIEYFYLEELSSLATEEQLFNFINPIIQVESVKIEANPNTPFNKAKISYDKKNMTDISILDSLDEKIIPNTNIRLKVSYSAGESVKKSVLRHDLIAKNCKEDDEILYKIPYHQHILTHYVKRPGADALKFIDSRVIENQRNVVKHFITKIGTNILSGSGIMNISLPINIFDERSLLEVFAHQCRNTPYFFEPAGRQKDPVEKLKYSVAFAVSRIHMSVTQLKPFNPIWGETFQCKIADTALYLEQTSHHPPVFHFLQLGRNFKTYGYQMPEASTGANSVSAKTRGRYFVHFRDGTRHVIYANDIHMAGTLFGDRTFRATGSICVVDSGNKYIGVVEFNPDERSFFRKLLTKSENFPDFFSGCICGLDQAVYDKDSDAYRLKEDAQKICRINGDWGAVCKIDGKIYWENSDKYKLYPLKRMKYTLQSDSTMRDDIYYMKNGDERNGEMAKIELEEIQRRDRKLRAQYKEKK